VLELRVKPNTNMNKLLAITLYLLFSWPLMAKELSDIDNIVLECSQFEDYQSIIDVKSCKDITINREEAPLTFPVKSKNDEVKVLRLDGFGWEEHDISLLARIFINTNHIVCIDCDVYKLRFLNSFKNLERINLTMIRTINKWEGPIDPFYTIDFHNLNYENIKEVNIYPSPATNISCKDIGLWWNKLNNFTPYISNPAPYKYAGNCYPGMKKAISQSTMGDKEYHQGNIEKANDLYLRAFSENPYHQSFVSNLSLTYYKKGNHCKSFQTAYWGASLINGTPETRSSIWFNLHLSLLKLGLEKDAEYALYISKKMRNNDRSHEALDYDFQSVCKNDDMWIDKLTLSIEERAVQLSRPHNVNYEFDKSETFYSFEDASKNRSPQRPFRLNKYDFDRSGKLDNLEFEYKKSLLGTCMCKPFDTLTIEIPTIADIHETYLTLYYFASDPKQTREFNIDGKLITVPAEGRLRIWNVDSNKKRNTLSVLDGGNYIAPNTRYPVLLLNPKVESNTLTLYIESVEIETMNKENLAIKLEITYVENE